MYNEIINEVNFFIEFDKPSVCIDLGYFTLNNLFSEKLKNRLFKNYSYSYYGNSILFFKCDFYKYVFMLAYNSNDENFVNTSIFGMLMGYPKSSIDFFSYSLTVGIDNLNDLGRLKVNYYGLKFISSKTVLETTFKELESMYGKSTEKATVENFILR